LISHVMQRAESTEFSADVIDVRKTHYDPLVVQLLDLCEQREAARVIDIAHADEIEHEPPHRVRCVHYEVLDPSRKVIRIGKEQRGLEAVHD
jgi:hypothetical protein